MYNKQAYINCVYHVSHINYIELFACFCLLHLYFLQKIIDNDCAFKDLNDYMLTQMNILTKGIM